jgi:hypothetical protein
VDELVITGVLSTSCQGPGNRMVTEETAVKFLIPYVLG